MIKQHTFKKYDRVVYEGEVCIVIGFEDDADIILGRRSGWGIYPSIGYDITQEDVEYCKQHDLYGWCVEHHRITLTNLIWLKQKDK